MHTQIYLFRHAHSVYTPDEEERPLLNYGLSDARTVTKLLQSERIDNGTHGNIMVLMMNYFNDRYGFEFWKQLEMPDIYKLSFTGVNLLNIRTDMEKKIGRDSRVKSVNYDKMMET